MKTYWSTVWTMRLRHRRRSWQMRSMSGLGASASISFSMLEENGAKGKYIWMQQNESERVNVARNCDFRREKPLSSSLPRSRKITIIPVNGNKGATAASTCTAMDDDGRARMFLPLFVDTVAKVQELFSGQRNALVVRSEQGENSFPVHGFNGN